MSQSEFPDNLPNGEGYRHWHYNPVTVNASNTVAAVFLGITCIMLLIALLRERQNRHQREH
jgi:hypothetical protein